MPEVDPLLVTMKDAGRILAVSTWQVGVLCNAGLIESRYIGRKRNVVLASLNAYVAGLPTAPPEDEAVSA